VYVDFPQMLGGILENYFNNSRLLLACVCFAATRLHASTIDSYTFTPDSSVFTTDLTESFTSTEAVLAGTISCNSTTTCSGELGTFDLGLDLTEPGVLSLTDVGGLTGDSSASGSVNLDAPIQQTRAFTVPVGNFDYTRYTKELPALGLIDVAGSVDLTLLPGQTLTLPVTIDFAAIPEPSGQVLLALAALGLAAFVRYRYSQRGYGGVI
jgi:hypothetical protein